MMQMDLHSVMVTPLVEKGNVLGLIYVDSKMSNRSKSAWPMPCLKKFRRGWGVAAS